VSRSRATTAAVDEVIRCRPAQGHACGHALAAQGGVVVGRRQVVELPAVQPRVIEAQRLRLRCRQCGYHTSGA
jgi:transposase